MKQGCLSPSRFGDQVQRRARVLTALLLTMTAQGVQASGETVDESHVAAAAPDFLRTASEAGRPGGRLVVTLRTPPGTLNPAVVSDNSSRTVVHRMTADLVHIDRRTQRSAIALARSWSVSPDGRRYRVELRRGLRFSDGHPLELEDVLFTFEVYLDKDVASPNRDVLIVGGEPIRVRKLDAETLELELKEPYAVGERLFDGIAVLPRHRLETAFREGRFSTAWALDTPPGEVAGLGPFRLKRYVPGERLELERNPYYWKLDREGQRLPYLDELVFLFVPDKEAEIVRFRAGETHLMDHLNAQSYSALTGEQQRRGFLVHDLGPGLRYEVLFFNLNDLPAGELPEVVGKQRWFRDPAFRQAVSEAIDREAITRLVYRGRAVPVGTHVTPGNKMWINSRIPPPQRSLTNARRKLRAAGFTWDAEGRLRDPQGTEVGFTLKTNAGNDERLRIATVIQEDLRQLGLRVRVTPLEFRALLDRVLASYDYEACLLGLGGGDSDPNTSMNVLLSSGRSHLWHLGRHGPAAPWEREIDRLMREQLTELDTERRKALYDRVQELVAENLPFIALVSPNVLVGASKDLGNLAPAVLDHSTLWNVDELFWRN